MMMDGKMAMDGNMMECSKGMMGDKGMMCDRDMEMEGMARSVSESSDLSMPDVLAISGCPTTYREFTTRL